MSLLSNTLKNKVERKETHTEKPKKSTLAESGFFLDQDIDYLAIHKQIRLMLNHQKQRKG